MLAFSCKFSAPVITVATTAKPMSVEELISVSALGCELGLSWFVLSPLDLAIVCTRFWLWADSLVLASCSLIIIWRWYYRYPSSLLRELWIRFELVVLLFQKILLLIAGNKALRRLVKSVRWLKPFRFTKSFNTLKLSCKVVDLTENVNRRLLSHGLLLVSRIVEQWATITSNRESELSLLIETGLVSDLLSPLVSTFLAADFDLVVEHPLLSSEDMLACECVQAYELMIVLRWYLNLLPGLNRNRIF